MEILKQICKIGKILEFSNKNLKFGKHLEICKKSFKFVKKIRKFGKNLEIWKNLGNLENIWEFEKICKFGNRLEKF